MYITGLSLIFFAGVLLVIALWPWNKEYYQPDKDYAHTKKGVDMERVAFFATALTTVISALFGAIPGSFFGNGFETFLAENIIRSPEKSVMDYSVIGHLHIMLALIAIMITLIIGRWLNFKGILHKIAMPLMILGTIVLNLGVWGVVTPLEPIAHMIIYVGATPSMLAALLLLIWELGQLIREGTPTSINPTLARRSSALVRDPLRFGPLWQMLFMNFTTSFIGIFMAVRLDEIFRVWPAREERIELTGHWHVLSAIIATIILLYYGDMIGLKGKLRQLYGWSIIILSDIAFGAVTIFEMKRLFISEATQQPLVNTLMLSDGHWPWLVTGRPGRRDDLALDRPVQEERTLDGRSGPRTLGGGESNETLISGPRSCFLLSFQSPAHSVDLNAPVPTFDTGVDPNAWATIPAGPFLTGQFNHPATIDYDYEMMVTDVTVRSTWNS